MPLHAILAGVFAQTCTAMLPPAQAEIEWFNDARPYAVDVPLRATRAERVYRREYETGRVTERVVSCTTTRGVTYYVEQIGSAKETRIPLSLKPGASRVVAGATVRRIDPPAKASARALWFAVTDPGVRLYALQSGIGVSEVRLPAANGGFSVLRGVLRDGAHKRAMAAADSQASALERRITELELRVATLTDSIAGLVAPTWNGNAPVDLPEIELVHYYTEHGAYHEALALLAHTRARVEIRPETATAKQRARARLDDAVQHVVQVCMRHRYQFRPRAAPRQDRLGSSNVPLLFLLSCAARPATLRFR